jgi:hypothetical protein
MAYWRMQLHPDEKGYAVRHSVESLAAGFIGLDFAADVGNLLTIDKSSIAPKQRPYWAFAHDMKQGDWVLIIAHHFPVALAQISGDYNYIRQPDQGIGVWFRHFRRVNRAMYYADLITNASKWEPIKMTETIAPLHEPSSKSYQLIEFWRGKLSKSATA